MTVIDQPFVRAARIALGLAAMLVAGCGDPAMEPAGATRSRAPALGKAGGSDSADRGCQVVLRHVSREFDGSGHTTQCVGGSCNYVWEATVEVADTVHASASVHILYRMDGDTQWWEVTGSPALDSGAGYRRYRFRLHQHLFGPALGQQQQAKATIRLIPFLRLADGSRVFDHNVHAGGSENYTLRHERGFSASDEGACQPVAGRISFGRDWRERLDGLLHQGGYLVVDYDLDRLPRCRGTHNGRPAWDIQAHVKFLPSGALVSGSVRRLQSNQGTPVNQATRRQLAVQIPAGAATAELWFHNFSGAGSSCSDYDSDHGANYRFPISPPVSDPRCAGVERWSSKYGGQPHCLAYAVDRHVDATHCELYLDGIGDGYEGHYGIPFNWIEAYLHVGPQQGQLLNAGMLTLYRDDQGVQRARVSLGSAVGAATYKTGFTYVHTGYMGSGSYTHSVERLAFFIDVRRPGGDVVRLWQSNGGADSRWSDAFGAGTTTKSIPYGKVKYATPDNAIFAPRAACK